MTLSLPQDPDTGYLHESERISLDELAVHLAAAARWLNHLALAAETPAVPLELGDNLCVPLERMAGELSRLGEEVAEVDQVISEHQPLRPYLGQREPWGSRAHGSDREQWGKRLSTVLSLRQVRHLRAADLEWRDEEPGIPYLAGIKDLPGIQEWESPRAAQRREARYHQLIHDQALQEHCTTCQAIPGAHCRTKNGYTAETHHRPRLKAATTTVDAALQETETLRRTEED